MPDSSWWIMLLVFHEIAGISAILCKYLQGHGTLICNQHHTLKRLVFYINSKVGIIRILLEVHRGAIDKKTRQLSDSVDYAVSFVAVRVLLRTWDCLLNTASPKWTLGIVTRCCNCLRLPSLD